MPLPIPAPVPGVQSGVSVQPYYVRDTQAWSVEQERQRHAQALYQVGEYAMFALMWHIQDFEAGLVDRCHRCTGAAGSVEATIMSVYKQPTQNRCIDCYGTTFEGGYRALIVRPAVFSDADQSEAIQARGVVNPSTLSVESTTDFRVRSGDYVFRADGDRFQLASPTRTQLRTGFGTVNQANSAIGYNMARAIREDPNTSVAFLIGPSAAALHGLLTRGQFGPEDFSADEVVRGPLIPSGD